MGVVVIKCPVTGHAVSTGIELEETTFEALPNVSSSTICSDCGRRHSWTKAEAWLSDGSALDGSRETSAK